MNKIYIIEATDYNYGESHISKISAWSTKEKAEEELKKYLRFYPEGGHYMDFYCTGAETTAACRYELVRLGLMFSWRDEYESVPFLKISEVDFIG